MTTDRYRVVSVTTPPVTLRTFADRTAAEAYRERVKGIVSNATRVQERVGQLWVDTEEEPR